MAGVVASADAVAAVARGAPPLLVLAEEEPAPAPLAPLVQSPAWLLSSMTDAYTAAKILNAVVMCAAVFPASMMTVLGQAATRIPDRIMTRRSGRRTR